MISVTENAAAQQYAIVVSNAQPDVPVHVKVYQDDSVPGEPNAPYEVAEATIAPYNLQVFKLGPREVDGSPPGQFNTGSNTALTRKAYQVVTDFPVTAYQFNPLDNVNVFSNDASLLKPREALEVDTNELLPRYVVAGWPQTIAITDDPNTNFDPADPIQLRAYLAIVGTAEGTHVRVHTRAAVVAGGPVPATPIGGVVEATLGPFDVLNLETGDFNADFTGSIIEADQAVAVFSGSEASDAPHFQVLAQRQCCADHLENQLDPIRTAGKSFAIAHNPSRTKAVQAAGANLAQNPEPDFVRFVSASPSGATIKTSLPSPNDTIVLKYLGDFAEVTAYGDFVATSSDGIHVSQVMPSQDASGVPRGLPGGDPSFVIYPPTEQYRAHYVFLTPDKYVFNFVAIVAPPDATVYLDHTTPQELGCETAPGDGLTDAQRGSSTPPWVVYRCQLSFPIIDPTADGAQQRLARRPEQRRPPGRRRPARGGHRLGVRLVRELRLRGRDQSPGDHADAVGAELTPPAGARTPPPPARTGPRPAASRCSRAPSPRGRPAPPPRTRPRRPSPSPTARAGATARRPARIPRASSDPASTPTGTSSRRAARKRRPNGSPSADLDEGPERHRRERERGHQELGADAHGPLGVRGRARGSRGGRRCPGTPAARAARWCRRRGGAPSARPGAARGRWPRTRGRRRRRRRRGAGGRGARASEATPRSGCPPTGTPAGPPCPGAPTGRASPGRSWRRPCRGGSGPRGPAG